MKTVPVTTNRAKRARRTSPQIFPWNHLPIEIRDKILSNLPLSYVFIHQTTFPHEAPSNFADRVTALYPLWRAWLHSPLEVRNTVQYRTLQSRKACTPLQFVSLERLILGGSQLSGCLTPAIGEFSHNLKVLHLDDNYLTQLPLQLQKCQKLLLLDCSNNRFSQFPPAACRLQNLTYILFARNQLLTHIPDAIADLPKLMTVSFDYCAISKLPISFIQKMYQTDRFIAHIAGNPFPHGYLLALCERLPSLKRRLGSSMVQ